MVVSLTLQSPGAFHIIDVYRPNATESLNNLQSIADDKLFIAAGVSVGRSRWNANWA
jgi:hypothetical protein